MRQRFVIEAVMVASYGHLLVPSRPVDFVMPYSSILELYEMRDGGVPVMEDPEDDRHVKHIIQELIDFFEEPLNRKKIEKALQVPWRESAPLLLNDMIQFTVIQAVDNAQYGEWFDPIETELLLTGIRLDIPLLSDQFEYEDRLIEAGVPVQIYDIEDFDFAVEEGIRSDDISIP